MELPALDFSMFDDIEPTYALDEDKKNDMALEVTKEEIYSVLLDIHDDKAPSNDGFSSFFFKVAWHVVGNDFTKAVQSFFHLGKLLKEVNVTRITLVPKVDSPVTLGDYRPTASCNVVYKCKTKILTNRMKRLIGKQFLRISQHSLRGDTYKIIYSCHMRYCMAITKLADKKGVVKVDLGRAYDMVRWEAIEFALTRFGVLQMFCNWVAECMRTAWYFIMVNGAPYSYF